MSKKLLEIRDNYMLYFIEFLFILYLMRNIFELSHLLFRSEIFPFVPLFLAILYLFIIINIYLRRKTGHVVAIIWCLVNIGLTMFEFFSSLSTIFFRQHTLTYAQLSALKSHTFFLPLGIILPGLLLYLLNKAKIKKMFT